MSRLRTAVVGVAVWCAVVAVVATLVWVVIDRAGQGVVPEARRGPSHRVAAGAGRRTSDPAHRAGQTLARARRVVRRRPRRLLPPRRARR